MKKENIEQWYRNLQDNICNSLEKLDGKATFKEDNWTRAEGGGGRTRVIAEGNLIEKGGVNFSAVYGPANARMLAALQVDAKGEQLEFYASGVSIVLHPHSPMVPIIHKNVRYFELSNGIWWFGGGIDLTPHYINPEQAKLFHTRLKSACDKHHPDFYPKFKKWADDYFFLSHRNETRGIGGIFYDRLNDKSSELTKEQLFEFNCSVGEAFIPAYETAVAPFRNMPFTEREINWQRLRRGRYVEYNLIHDRGTKFGLETNGRTESILMSLPPQANWIYDFKPEPDSPEAYTMEMLKKEMNWI
jgi:coproporphyrinogen III oxidase